MGHGAHKDQREKRLKLAFPAAYKEGKESLAATQEEMKQHAKKTQGQNKAILILLPCREAAYPFYHF